MDDIEKIRHKLARISLDDPEQIEDVMSDISFSITEKSSTIAQLNSVIEELRQKQNQDLDSVSFVFFY